MTYVAYYAPKLREGQEDPSAEFPTEEAAWEYIFNRMCARCKKDRELALAGDEENGYFYPACSCEWFVLTKEDYDKSESFADILRASGYTKEGDDGSGAKENNG